MAAKERTDRRVRRTRALLHTALIELILERGYDRVTVQDILDRADVGRSTFYSHYQTKDELLLSGMYELEAVLRARISAGLDEECPGLTSPLRPLFEHADGNRALFQAMLGGRANHLALRAGRRMLRDILATHLRARLGVTDDERLDMAVAFLVDGLLGVLVRWLDTMPHLTAARVHTDFDHLAGEGIRAFLRDAPERDYNG